MTSLDKAAVTSFVVLFTVGIATMAWGLLDMMALPRPFKRGRK